MKLLAHALHMSTAASTAASLALAIATALATFPAHASAGGGSSTGGGHVRVCLKPAAAAKVKAVMKQSTLVPQIASNPFEGIATEDILSVDLLDLLERPDLYAAAKPILAQLADVVHKEKNYADEVADKGDPIIGNESVKMITQSASHMIALVEKSKGPEWTSDSSELYSNASPAGKNDSWAPWTPSPTGLRITNDFDPRLSIPDHCVFAQAVRQSVFTRHFATFDFDQKLVSHMSDDTLIVLGLHESMYSAVMLAPNYYQVTNPSVLTRRLTTLALGIASGQITENEPEFRAIIDRLGYGPYVYLQKETAVKTAASKTPAPMKKRGRK